MIKNKRILIITAILTLIIACVSTAVYITQKGSQNKFFKQIDWTGQQMGTNEPQVTNQSTNQAVGTKVVEPQKDNSQQGYVNDKKEEEKQPKQISEEFKVKAIYLTGSSAGDEKRIKHIIDLVKTTELNSVVIDIKDDYGKVNYKSGLSEVNNYSAYHELYDVDHIIKILHQNNVHVIGRIVCFKDPALATKRADLAIKRPNGQLWRENGVTPWASPYNEEVWKYNIDIAKEAVDKGFDEIQFDYVRFPTTRKSDVSYGENVPTKSEIITKFVETVQKELHDKGVVFSADVFGIICESPGDFENIGQELEKVGKNIDYLSPMVYPSHYANKKQNGSGQMINGVMFTAPDLEPYKVVYNSLVKAKNRVAKVEGYKAKFRPYLQDFTASWLPKGYYQSYGATQVRQQIKAVYDAGYDEWILWDAFNTYSEDAFEKRK